MRGYLIILIYITVVNSLPLVDNEVHVYSDYSKVNRNPKIINFAAEDVKSTESINTDYTGDNGNKNSLIVAVKDKNLNENEYKTNIMVETMELRPELIAIESNKDESTSVKTLDIKPILMTLVESIVREDMNEAKQNVKIEDSVEKIKSEIATNIQSSAEAIKETINENLEDKIESSSTQNPAESVSVSFTSSVSSVSALSESSKGASSVIVSDSTNLNDALRTEVTTKPIEEIIEVKTLDLKPVLEKSEIISENNASQNSNEESKTFDVDINKSELNPVISTGTDSGSSIVISAEPIQNIEIKMVDAIASEINKQQIGYTQSVEIRPETIIKENESMDKIEMVPIQTLDLKPELEKLSDSVPAETVISTAEDLKPVILKENESNDKIEAAPGQILDINGATIVSTAEDLKPKISIEEYKSLDNIDTVSVQVSSDLNAMVKKLSDSVVDETIISTTEDLKPEIVIQDTESSDKIVPVQTLDLKPELEKLSDSVGAETVFSLAEADKPISVTFNAGNSDVQPIIISNDTNKQLNKDQNKIDISETVIVNLSSTKGDQNTEQEGIRFSDIPIIIKQLENATVPNIRDITVSTASSIAKGEKVINIPVQIKYEKKAVLDYQMDETTSTTVKPDTSNAPVTNESIINDSEILISS